MFQKLFLLFVLTIGMSGQTLGLLYSDPAQVWDGYTLFMPTAWNEAYLIDNDGYIVHSWEGALRPGQAVYLNEAGQLIKTCQYPGPPSYYNAGGRGGLLRIYSWENELVWNLDWWGEEQCQHHDCEYNETEETIFFISWHKKTATETIAAGRDPAGLEEDQIWAEKIVEVRPVGSDGYEIVWVWDVWDHLIQNFDAELPNYGNPSDNPGRIDINHFIGDGEMDWLHINGIDYNSDLDQILLSCHNFNEIWIIDHSTCDYEDPESGIAAAGGEAGDLLYRWGNPAAWGMGSPMDQKLFGQHDALWIIDGRPGAGNITIYNNGTPHPRRPYSSVDEIETPLLPDGSYELSPGSAYAPSDPVWSYTDDPETDFFSSAISGATRLPNGNTIICEGNNGRIFEVTEASETVWEYINPVTMDGPQMQGTVIFDGNHVFKVQKYGTDYAGLSGRDLTPSGTVELPEEMIVEANMPSHAALSTHPNPFNSALQISAPENAHLTIHDTEGRIVANLGTSRLWNAEDDVASGIYIVRAVVEDVVVDVKAVLIR